MSDGGGAGTREPVSRTADDRTVETATGDVRTGRCLCGAVTYSASGPMRSASLCHCGQCRRQAGHAWASAVVPRAAVAARGPLEWFRSSPGAERGFCPRCGSSLFWRMDGEDTMSVSLGSLDAPTGLTLEAHIFVAHKGDYYRIEGDLPRRP